MFGWFRKREPQKRTAADRMTTLASAEVYYLPITKCGSTYLKNLFYYLDNDAEQGEGLRIHKEGTLPRAKSGDGEKIRNSRHAFTVLRDPTDRFVSLYFDKIYGDGQGKFPRLRRELVNEINLDLSRDLSEDQHRQNCMLLIDWVGQNLAYKTTEPVNHHWRWQSARLKRVEELELEHLTLDGLDWQLPILIKDIVPNIREAMLAVKSRNRAEKPISREALVDDALRKKIEDVYAADKRLYLAAKKRWAERKPTN